MLLWGVVCLKLQLWSFSLPMDGLLVIEFPMDNFVLGSQTESSFFGDRKNFECNNEQLYA